jgi:hypothetical protein
MIITDAEYSGNWLFTIDPSVKRYSTRQNVLVGRSEIGTLPEASKVVDTLHGLAR